mmetsp:Transcript_38668/g.74149  ORF Transcript_38668/g.74149 Transcript_38668/m.74149 type:complete len:207 (-) Transcript_38668:3167-3787(-)
MGEGGALGGLVFQARLEDVSHGAFGEVRGDIQLTAVAHHRLHHLLLLHALPRVQPRHQLPQHHTEAVHVARLRDGIAAQHLRRAPLRGAALARPREEPALLDAGQAKVAHLHHPVLVHQKVARLEVAVHHVHAVHVLHRARHVQRHLQPPPLVQAVVHAVLVRVEQSEQGPARQVLRNNGQLGRLGHHSHEEHDVRVAEIAHQQSL